MSHLPELEDPPGNDLKSLAISIGFNNRRLRDFFRQVAAVKVGSFAGSGSTGNQSVTGLGFKPRIVRFYYQLGDSATVATFSVGAADEAGNQFFNAMRASGGANRRVSGTDACIAGIINDAGGLEKAAIVSMDADGFTVNWSVATTATVFFEAEG